MIARRLLLALVTLAASACAGATAPIRRAAERGELTQALRLYNEYADERGDGDPDVLADVALAVLRDAAGSADGRQRAAGFAALRGLGASARPVLEGLALRDGVVGDRATSVLFELEGRRGAVPPRLRAALRSDDIERRVAGLVGLRGRRGLARLVTLSRDPDPVLRAAVARELARRRGAPEAADALAALAREDSDTGVRMAAVSALGAHGDRAVETLRAALQDADGVVRMMAPSALASAVPDGCAELLAPLLVDPFSNLGIESARVLAMRGDARGGTYILRALREATPPLRAQAAVAASALGEAHDATLAAMLAERDPEVSIRVGAILVRREAWRQQAIDALRPVAARPDAFAAIRALGVLAAAGDPWALDPIRQALAASDANVRRLAVLAWPLAIGPRGSDCDALAPLLQDADRSVALLAAVEIVLIASR